MIRFFFDRSADRYVARMLNAWDRDNTITHQEDDRRFVQGDPDTKIIRLAASDTPKPVFITADEANKKHPEERRALAEAEMTVVFLKSGYHDIDFHTRSWKFLALWPELVRTVSRVKAPTAFEITAAMKKLDRICLTADLAQTPTRRKRR